MSAAPNTSKDGATPSHIPPPSEFFGSPNNLGGDDDDDLDAMFEKYLGDVDAAQLKALMTMGDEDVEGSYEDEDDAEEESSSTAAKKGPKKVTTRKTAAGAKMSKGARKAMDALARGADDEDGGGSSDDDRPNTSSRIPTSATGDGRVKAKRSTAKKSSLAATSSGTTTTAKRTPSKGPASTTTTTKLGGTLPTTSATKLGAKASTTTTSQRGVSPSVKGTPSGLNKSPARGSISSSGTPAIAATRPSLLPNKKGTKAPTANVAPLSGASMASSVSRLATPPTTAGEPSSSKRPLTSGDRNDSDDGGDSDDDEADDTTSAVIAATQKEPFRYEANVKLPSAHKGPITATAAQSGTTSSGKGTSPFGFQDLVAAVLSPEDRAARNTPEQISEALALAKIVDLSGRNVDDADDLMCLDSVTHLYLQHNKLTDVGGLSALMRLTVLVISHNQLESIAPLASLDFLIFLDASYNKIAELDASTHLPTERLVELRLNGNPCSPDYDLLEADAGEGDEKKKNKATDPSLLDEHYEYLEQYRAEILTYCPLLKYLDTYEVASFAPEHVREAADNDPQPRLLAAIVAEGKEEDAANGDNNVIISDDAVMRAVEDEIEAAMREDMEGDRGEVVDAGVEAAAATTNTFGAFVTQAARYMDDKQQPSGLSELQAKLMDAYLGGSTADGAAMVGGLTTASSRPGTATLRTSTSSLRPGTAQRPMSAVAASVAALKAVGGGDDSSSSDDEGTAAPSRASVGKAKGCSDPLAGGRLGGAGRIGSTTSVATASAQPQNTLVAPPEEDPRAYAKLSDRQKELAKELAIAQRHRDKVAELQLMELWDEASGSMRDLRVKSEDRRRQLLFAGAGVSGGDANSSGATNAPSPTISAMANSNRSTFLRGMAANTNSSAAVSAPPTTSAKASHLDNSLSGVAEEGMQHSAGYLAALERLRSEAGVSDINKYRKAVPTKK